MRGFKDNLPPTSYLIQEVQKKFQGLSNIYGYDTIDLPLVENADFYFRTSGSSSDVCNKELFEVRRYKDKFKNWVLRPEGTASFMRAIQESGWLNSSKIIKGSYFGPMFRYNRPQKGRYRQFLQAGFEYVGSNSIFSDLEVIKMACDFLQTLNINFDLEINSIGNAQDRSIYRDVLRKELEIDAQTDPLKVIDKSETFENIPKLKINDEDAKNFDQLLNLLEKNNIKYNHNPYLVRGLDYYNALVFEIKVNGQTILAGGRYDGLMGQISSSSACAVGFAAGVDRIAELLNMQHENKKVYIIPSDASEYGYKIMQQVQLQYKNGCVVLWDMDLKKALKFVNGQNGEYVIICGKLEEENAQVNLKNMKTGEQKATNISELKLFFKI